MDEKQCNSYSSKYLCKLLMDYRRPILIILAVAALCAIIFSAPYFITPLYTVDRALMTLQSFPLSDSADKGASPAV